MNSHTISIVYGSEDIESTAFVVETEDERFWYVVRGAKTANCTYEEIEEGQSVEIIEDVDCFTTESPIWSRTEFIQHVEEYEEYLSDQEEDEEEEEEIDVVFSLVQGAFSNDAFHPDPNAELARILRAAADQLESGREHATLVDINGNVIGDINIYRS